MRIALSLLLLAVATPAPAQPPGPRHVPVDGVENLVAFARLLGYVRYFHPEPAAMATDWESFSVRGSALVERAPTADSLATVLRGLFASVAPTLRIERPSSRAAAPAPSIPADSAAVMYWEHFGVGIPATRTPTGRGSRVYRSVLVTRAAPGFVLPPGAPDPARPLTLELPGGHVAVVPTARWTRVAPSTTAANLVPEPPALPTHLLQERATRYGAIITFWNVMQHFYPYFDVVPDTWDEVLPRALREARGASVAAFDTTLKHMAAALHDGHANIVGGPAAEPRTPLPIVLDWVENQVVVTHVVDSATTLRRGDVVLAVDGEPVADGLARRQALFSGTPQWTRWRALTDMTLGYVGRASVLRVRGVDGRERAVEVTRVQMAPAEPRPEPIADVAPGVLYVDIDRVTDSMVVAALPRMTAAEGIVFDLRGYPRRVLTPTLLSRLTDTTVFSAHFEVPRITRPDREGWEHPNDGAWRLTPGSPRIRARVAWITNGRAISYSESTLGVVEHYGLGDIVGAPTAGANGNVNPFRLPGGPIVSWTGMRVRKRDGSVHHGVGIQPTIPAQRTLRGVIDGRDELLERAIQVVRRR
jgi:hypothetical protein